MNKHRFLLAMGATLAVGALFLALTNSGQRKPSPPPTPTTTTTTSTPTPTVDPTTTASSSAPAPDLVEEFDTLDLTRWNLRNEFQDNDNSRNLPQNVVVTNGIAGLVGKNESYTDSSGVTKPYTSADMETYGKYELPNYFRVSVTAKLPMEVGMWPAPLWLRARRYGASADGEIDLIETYYGREKDSGSGILAHATMHSEYGATHQAVERHIAYSSLANPDPAGWHTYVCEKTPGRITVWVDEAIIGTWDASNTPFFDRIFEAPDTMWALRSTLQIGGQYAGEPDASTEWGDKTTMFIDNIKTWQLSPLTAGPSQATTAD